MRPRCLSTAALAVTCGVAAGVETYGICTNNSAIGRCFTVVELVVIGLSQRLRNRLRPSRVRVIFRVRSYWILGSDASAVSEKRNAFFRLLKNKSFKEESMAIARMYTIGTFMTLESNKSHGRL